MKHWSDQPFDPQTTHLLAEELKARGIVLADDVEVAGDRIWVMFPESDFAIHVEPTDEGRGMRVSVSTTVRAPAPSLETWWSEWKLGCTGADLAADVHAEVVRARGRHQRLLTERFIDESA